jgi:hypothetical protein
MDIKVVSILNREEQAKKKYQEMVALQEKEKELISSYLKNNNVVVKPDTNGIYKTNTKSGNGKRNIHTFAGCISG